ncbi:MAG: protoporphyrinogen oxidase HemJ [Proteobacteria bacterium]|nr:protoporphyrinogen oxidase HemJ [Pseudomonadota bacterium]
MRWILAFHIIFMVAWFAGLFYLPRLFMYHTLSVDSISINRFKIMERKLFYMIMTPAGILTTLFGVWLMVLGWAGYQSQGWLHLKLVLVLLLWIYHGYCGYLLKLFRKNNNQKTAHFYRWFNEIPTLLLIVIVILAVVKPF